MFEGHNYKKQARMQLSHHWKTPLLISLAIAAFYAVLFFITYFIQYKQMIADMMIFQQTTTMASYYNMVASYYNMAWPLWINALVMYLIFGIIIMLTCNFYISFAKDNNNSTFTTFLEGFALWSKGVRGYLWIILWAGLWSLLFYIPGIVKSIAYSQMFFIMADSPKVGVCRAMKLSMAMTKGYKGELFMMVLSFLGWIILASLPYFIALFGVMGNMMVTIMANADKGMGMDMGNMYQAFFPPLIIGLTLSSIGFLLLLPYMLTSFTYAYQYMKQDAINRKVLTYADFGQDEPVQTLEKPRPAIDGTATGNPTV